MSNVIQKWIAKQKQNKIFNNKYLISIDMLLCGFFVSVQIQNNNICSLNYQFAQSYQLM